MKPSVKAHVVFTSSIKQKGRTKHSPIALILQNLTHHWEFLGCVKYSSIQQTNPSSVHQIPLVGLTKVVQNYVDSIRRLSLLVFPQLVMSTTQSFSDICFTIMLQMPSATCGKHFWSHVSLIECPAGVGERNVREGLPECLGFQNDCQSKTAWRFYRCQYYWPLWRPHR